ncbi:MAG TPA: CBS domain-containing protein [Mariprofundaceae bacterium]|nr:CBS domain-containing protein [Mariprofundaceae bacterium]
MHANSIMVKKPTTAHVDESVAEVLVRMREKQLRMLPVLSDGGMVEGVISTHSILIHIIPDYIVSGDLDSVPYAPDIGLLRRHYDELAGKTVREVMDKALLVHANDSLLSVSAALCTFGRHEYALVVDEDKVLLGVISAGDILDPLRFYAKGDADV